MKQLIILASAVLLSTYSYGQQYSFSRQGERKIEETDANTSGEERFNIHFQHTYVYQYKSAMASPYQGFNSLTKNEARVNSVSTTLYLGARLWKGAEIYVNPEITAGDGFSNNAGMAGSSNGETFRVTSSTPTLYLARAYFKQTFAIRNQHARRAGTLNSEETHSCANQLAGYVPKNYIRIYAGKLSLPDVFDNNIYSNSPRSQFLNWSLMNNGAWDFAANNHGYTYSFIAEAQLEKTNLKAGISTLPSVANGQHLNTYIDESYAINAELTRLINIHKRPGNIRLLGFYNVANMGNYDMAVANAIGIFPPDVLHVAKKGNTKYGLGLSIDQQLNNTLGVFARIGWNDGQNATWCFTEIDQTISLGLSANGNAWHRSNDKCGIAIVVNGISQQHRNYLANGGYGLMLGDGKLNYANEMITELYYSLKPIKQGLWVTADYQFCMNPGYNKDRGPVHIVSARLHIEL